VQSLSGTVSLEPREKDHWSFNRLVVSIARKGGDTEALWSEEKKKKKKTQA